MTRIPFTAIVFDFIFIPNRAGERTFQRIFPTVNQLVHRVPIARVVFISLQKFVIMPDNGGIPIGNTFPLHAVPFRCRLEIVSVADDKNSFAVKGRPVLFILRHDLAGSDHNIVLARRLNGGTDRDTVFRLRAVIVIVGVRGLVVAIYRDVMRVLGRVHAERNGRYRHRRQQSRRDTSPQSFTR